MNAQVEVMKDLRHRHIVSIIGYHEEEGGFEGGPNLVILLEFVAGESLDKVDSLTPSSSSFNP